MRLVDVPAEGTDATLFCIHGLGGQAEQFMQMLPFLAGRCRVVAMDWPGHGASDKPRGDEHYSAARIVENLYQVEQKINL